MIETKSGVTANKLLFIAWSDDNATTRPKMLYASSKDAIKKALVGINDEYQATECGSTSTVRARSATAGLGLSLSKPQRLSLSASAGLLKGPALLRRAKGPFASRRVERAAGRRKLRCSNNTQAGRSRLCGDCQEGRRRQVGDKRSRLLRSARTRVSAAVQLLSRVRRRHMCARSLSSLQS